MPSLPAPEALRFSLVSGGPVHRFLCRLRLVRGDDHDVARTSIAFVAVMWGPLLALAALERLVRGRWDPLLADYAVHARVLVAVPLLFLSERWLHVMTGLAVEGIVRNGLADAAPAALERTLARAERVRDARTSELLLFVAAVVASESVLWRVGPTGLVSGATSPLSRSLPALWYGAAVLPSVLFLTARWVFRWAIWSVVVFRISLLPLRLVAFHPDRQGGAGLLAKPTMGFALGIAAFSVVQAGAWATRVIHEGTPVKSFAGGLATMLVLALVIVLGPLMTWFVPMRRARLRGEAEFSGFAMDYVRRFDAKWIRARAQGAPEELLGTPDLQSLADLANSFAVARGMRVLPFDKIEVAIVVAAVIVPVVPVVLLEIPLAEILRRLAAGALGGPPS